MSRQQTLLQGIYLKLGLYNLELHIQQLKLDAGLGCAVPCDEGREKTAAEVRTCPSPCST